MRKFKSAAIFALACLAGGNVAIAQTALPENTIKCEAFKKQPNGWYVGAPTTFDIGDTKAMTIGNQLIAPNTMNLGGANLYEVLERKCGGRR
jgi:hypothetical protein